MQDKQYKIADGSKIDGMGTGCSSVIPAKKNHNNLPTRKTQTSSWTLRDNRKPEDGN